MVELTHLQSYGAPLTSTSASLQLACPPSECSLDAPGGLTTTRLMKPRPQGRLVPWNTASWKRSRSQPTLVLTAWGPRTGLPESPRMVTRHRNETPSLSDLGRIMIMVMIPTSSLTTSTLKLLPRTRHNRTGPLLSFLCHESVLYCPGHQKRRLFIQPDSL